MLYITAASCTRTMTSADLFLISGVVFQQAGQVAAEPPGPTLPPLRGGRSTRRQRTPSTASSAAPAGLQAGDNKLGQQLHRLIPRLLPRPLTPPPPPPPRGTRRRGK